MLIKWLFWDQKTILILGSFWTKDNFDPFQIYLINLGILTFLNFLLWNVFWNFCARACACSYQISPCWVEIFKMYTLRVNTVIWLSRVCKWQVWHFYKSSWSKLCQLSSDKPVLDWHNNKTFWLYKKKWRRNMLLLHLLEVHEGHISAPKEASDIK